MANLQDDIGAAIVATIVAASARFTVVAAPQGTLAVEYAGQEVNYNAGSYGKVLVRPEPVEAVPGTDYDESAQSVFPFSILFDGLDVKDAVNARSVITQAIHATFRDRGADLWANFTDNGSNRLGGSGRVEIGEVVEVPSRDPDRPGIQARINVTVWHIVPLA